MTFCCNSKEKEKKLLGDELAPEEAQDESTTMQVAVQSDTLFHIDGGLDHIDGKTRFSLHYCKPLEIYAECKIMTYRLVSNHIANLIAVINLGFNGYRDLVLPQAEIDPLVRKAIVVIVEQHLSLQNGTTVSLDPTAYSSLVRDLITRSERCAPQDDESALTVLLLLHIREMISGSPNFKLVYGSLRVVVNALGQGLDAMASELRKFVEMQILRYVSISRYKRKPVAHALIESVSLESPSLTRQMAHNSSKHSSKLVLGSYPGVSNSILSSKRSSYSWQT